MVERRIPRPAELRPLLRPAPFVRNATERRLQRAASIADLRAIARRRTPRAVFDYTDGAADGELSLNRARAAFARVEFHPTVLRDVSTVDTSREMLGRRSALPFAFAPDRLHPDDAHRPASGRWSRWPSEVGHPVHAVHDGHHHHRGRRRGRAGRPPVVPALPVAGPRPGQGPGAARRRRRLRHPDAHRGHPGRRRPGCATCATGSPCRPRCRCAPSSTGPCTRTGGSTCSPPSRCGSPAWQSTDGTVAELINRVFDPALTMADVEWLRDTWPGKLMIKGIQSVEDARRVVDAGADAVLLSNHGGRQLDRAPVPLELVEPTVQAVGDRAEVYVDTGITNGADIVAAVALGAAGRAGRPGLPVRADGRRAARGGQGRADPDRRDHPDHAADRRDQRRRAAPRARAPPALGEGYRHPRPAPPSGARRRTGCWPPTSGPARWWPPTPADPARRARPAPATATRRPP